MAPAEPGLLFLRMRIKGTAFSLLFQTSLDLSTLKLDGEQTKHSEAPSLSTPAVPSLCAKSSSWLQALTSGI